VTYPSTGLTYSFETRASPASAFREAGGEPLGGGGAWNPGRELLILLGRGRRDGSWTQGLPSTLLPRYLELRVLPQATLPELERKCHTAPAFRDSPAR
jgi:hypothetical protein